MSILEIEFTSVPIDFYSGGSIRVAVARRGIRWKAWSSVPIRREPVGRFPYQVVYARVDDTVYILAVAHHHRRPGYWARRIPL
jgi:hypothetical protein